MPRLQSVYRWQCQGYSLCIDRRFAAQHRHSHTAGQFPNLEDGNKITNPISGCAALIYNSPRFVIYMSPPRSTSKFISQSTYSAFISRGL